MTSDEQAPKLHIDSDWKAQAQAEKDRLAAEEAKREAEKPSAGQGGPGGLPEASFQTLVGLLTSQAIMGLGAMADQKTGAVAVDLEGARFNIDLLAVLEEKTKGNLSDEESKELTQVLQELRSRFVYISELVAKQMAAGGGVPGAAPGGQAGIVSPDLTT